VEPLNRGDAGLSCCKRADFDLTEQIGYLLDVSGCEFIDHQVPVNARVVTKDRAKRVLVCLQIGGAEGLIGHALDD
jgi:hypothetical protein